MMSALVGSSGLTDQSDDCIFTEDAWDVIRGPCAAEARRFND
jgi:hypothetical protein